MKKPIGIGAWVLLTLTVAACQKSGGGSNYPQAAPPPIATPQPALSQQGVPPSGILINLSPQDLQSYLNNVQSYEIKSDKCLTGKRTGINLDDLCFILQVDENNGTCVQQDERKAKFEATCSGRTWEPARAMDEINNSNQTIECSLRESHKRSDIAPSKVTQVTSRDVMILELEHSKAVIIRSWQNGSLAVRIDTSFDNGVTFTNTGSLNTASGVVRSIAATDLDQPNLIDLFDPPDRASVTCRLRARR